MRTIVVTGGSRGLGRGLVEAFLARGANVAFCGRTRASVDAALASLAPAERVLGVVADVAILADVERLWDAAEARFGGVDGWICNAGTSNVQKDFVDLPPGDIAAVVGANLIGTMNGAHVAVTRMCARGTGHFFTMEGYGSDGATQRGMSIYAATKAAIRSFTRSLAHETRGSVVRVSSLSPGIVVTDLLVDVYQAGDRSNWDRNRWLFRLVADPVEVVAPWLADRVLARPAHGAHVAWMTVPKAVLRAFSPYYLRRDPFAGRRLPQ